jgi:hypothetical protein
MKKCVIAVLMCLLALGTVANFAYAGETDILLEEFVNEGIISGAKAQQIKIRVQERVKKEIAAGKSETLPAWLQTTKIKGDFRLRYQYNHGKTVADQTSERHRGRFRLRLGVESKVNDKLLVALGLATGLSDTGGSTVNKDYIRSTNQSFDNSFAKHPINLDYAFAKYTATPWLSLIGGKMLLKDALWEPGDLMWDTDITPEGAVFDIAKKLNSNTGLFLKTGFFVFEEDSASGDDPWMAHVQPGVDINLTDAISLRSALAFDYFGVGNTTLNGSGKTNSWYSTGESITPKKDVVNIMPAVEVKFKEPFKALGIKFLNFPEVKLFGEYVRNLNDSKPDDNKSGFMLGFGFGAAKVEGFGDWQASYNFARLERDAILDILPDSDRYDGKTSMRGHEFKLSYGLGKNTWLDFDIYRIQRIPYPGAATKAPETLVQVDWNMKF